MAENNKSDIEQKSVQHVKHNKMSGIKGMQQKYVGTMYVKLITVKSVNL